MGLFRRLAFAVSVLALSTCAGHQPNLVASVNPPGMIQVTDITDAELAPVINKIDSLVRDGETRIMLRLNSWGGSIFSGLDFIQKIEEHQKAGVHFTCVVDTQAMSMAFVILQAACDHRLMTKRSVLLAHNGRMATGGTADELKEIAEVLNALDEAMASIIADRMEMPVEEYKAKVKGKDWILPWTDALLYNAIDGTVDPKVLPPVYMLAPPPMPLFILR